MEKKIIRNSIKCKHCGEIIISTDRHDFVFCKCGACAVDGGSEYIRRYYKNDPESDFIELSIFEDNSVN